MNYQMPKNVYEGRSDKLKERMDKFRGEYSGRQEVRPAPAAPPVEGDPTPSEPPARPLPHRFGD